MYDVYDETKMIMEGVTAKEAAKAIGVSPATISYAANHGSAILNRYAVAISGEKVEPLTRAEREFAQKFGTENLKQWRVLNERYGHDGKRAMHRRG